MKPLSKEELEQQIETMRTLICPVNIPRFEAIVLNFKLMLANAEKEISRWKPDPYETTRESGREL